MPSASASYPATDPDCRREAELRTADDERRGCGPPALYCVLAATISRSDSSRPEMEGRAACVVAVVLGVVGDEGSLLCEAGVVDDVASGVE